MKDKYVLISPVHNEERHIDGLVGSVVSQTVRPQLWLLVNDASSDATGSMIARYSTKYDFIQHIDLQRTGMNTYYGRKVLVFQAGYRTIKDRGDYDFIGNLDADVLMKPTYYENILREFAKDPALGIAGGFYVYLSQGRLQRVLFNALSVPGCALMFRRECFEEIGGYVPLKHGGEDTLAEIMARMNGWRTRSFPEHTVVQRRFVGTAEKSLVRARFCQGLAEHSVATHPLFMLAKSLRRVVLERPYVVASAARVAGYLYAYCTREQRQIPREAVRFVRQEQMGRLLDVLRRPSRE